MTFQELLVEFNNRRISGVDHPKMETQNRLMNIEWALQVLIEKLRDTQEGPKP